MKYSLILDQVLHISRISCLRIIVKCFWFCQCKYVPMSKLKKKKGGGVSF